MKNLKTQHILTALIILCLVLIFAGVTLSYLTTSYKEELRESKETIFASDSEVVVSLKQAVQRLRGDIDKMESYFIDHKNAVGFIERLEEIASLAGVTIEIDNIDFMEKTRNQKVFDGDEVSITQVRSYGEIMMTLRTSGSWQDTMSFLATLEQLNKKLVVTGLRLTAVSSEDSGIIWNASFRLSGLTD